MEAILNREIKKRQQDTSRYKTGKVYKLVNNADDRIYISSTCMPLFKRLYTHKQSAKKAPKPYEAELSGVGWNNVKIVLIEDVICQNKNQLKMREQYHIDKLKPALNKPQEAKKETKEAKPQKPQEPQEEKPQKPQEAKPQEPQEAKPQEPQEEKPQEPQEAKPQEAKEPPEETCEHNNEPDHCKYCIRLKNYCKDCQYGFMSPKTLEKHKGSKTHKKALERLYIKKTLEA